MGFRAEVLGAGIKPRQSGATWRRTPRVVRDGGEGQPPIIRLVQSARRKDRRSSRPLRGVVRERILRGGGRLVVPADCSLMSSEMEGHAEGVHGCFVQGFAPGGVGVDRISEILEARPHLESQSEWCRKLCNPSADAL